MKKKTYRHGEILFVETKEIPQEAKLKNTDTLMVGSGNNSHQFKGGKFYEFNDKDYIFGYLEAENTILIHPEHGDNEKKGLMEAKLPNGIYELRKGREFINSEFRQIID